MYKTRGLRLKIRKKEHSEVLDHKILLMRLDVVKKALPKAVWNMTPK